jgi:hypothetical protein
MSGSVLLHVLKATPPHEKTEHWSRRIYKEMVRTYQDLLVTNLAFLHGVLQTFYYGGEALNEEHQASTGTLRELHTYGVFTVDGQGNACEPNYRERSYVMAAVPKAMATPLLQQVVALGSKVKYVFAPTEGGSVLATNFTPSDFQEPYFPRYARKPKMMFGFPLTQSKYPWSEDTWINDTLVFQDRIGTGLSAFQDAKDMGLDKVATILRDATVTVQLVISDFCSPLVADHVLLDCVKKAGFERVLTDPFEKPGMPRLQGGYCVHAAYGIKR